MAARYNTHRAPFTTAVPGRRLGAVLGVACCGTAASRAAPEDRVGMLFWRMHRAARILFSLNFHLGR